MPKITKINVKSLSKFEYAEEEYLRIEHNDGTIEWIEIADSFGEYIQIPDNQLESSYNIELNKHLLNP